MFNIMQEMGENDVSRIKNLLKNTPLNPESKMPSDIPDNAKFKFKVSSESVDRDGEILRADGADFKWYRKNPIVLLNHWASVENIIGKCTKIWQEGTDTYAEGYFSQTNPKAKLVQDLYNEKMVNVVSVGFMIKERDANDRNIITKWEMYEFSICAIQSNRDAERTDDQKAMLKKAIDSGLVEENTPSTKKKVANAGKKDSIEADAIDLSQFSSLMWEAVKDLEKTLGEKIDKGLKKLSDDKDNQEKIDKEALEKAKKLKPDLQKMAKGLSAHLENIKKL